MAADWGVLQLRRYVTQEGIQAKGSQKFHRLPVNSYGKKKFHLSYMLFEYLSLILIFLSQFNNIQVSRRYKHFDWLHERLEEKYCFIPIPPLPDKQISGRYEDAFIEHRRTQLQEFVDYVCRHPVLSRSRVWEHFITCTDEKRWKAGKRQAEKDELLGVNYFNAIQCPDTPMDVIKMEIQTDTFGRFISGLDPMVKNFMAMAVDQAKKHQVLYKREFQKIGQSFTSLSHALEADDNGRGKLTHALKATGDAYNDIGRLYEEQPKFDWEPLSDKFHIYRGIISNFPDVTSIHKVFRNVY